MIQESSPSPTLPNAQPTSEFAVILSNFLDVTKPHYGNHTTKHDITHHITIINPPVSAHPRCLSPEKLKISRQKFGHTLQEEPSDVHKTAITMPFSLFEFLHMPFGICNATQIFQRFIDQVLHNLRFCYVMITISTLMTS